MALNPFPMYKKVASLNCIISEQFYYWNEESGPHIDLFWSELAKNGTITAEKIIDPSRPSHAEQINMLLERRI